MKANELRIGNYFSWEGVDTILKLEHFQDHLLYPNDARKYQPIPLTEEWLIKFGFGTELGFPNEYFNNVALEQVVIVYDLTHSLFNLETDSGDVININIQHVNQLQNLYFALTDEELTSK